MSDNSKKVSKAIVDLAKAKADYAFSKDQQIEYEIEEAKAKLTTPADMEFTTLPGGEVVPAKESETPDQIELEASLNRIKSLENISGNLLISAMDAAHSIKARDSLEKMLINQMALINKNIFTLVRVNFPVCMQSQRERELRMDDLKRLQIAMDVNNKSYGLLIKLMKAYQDGMVTLARYRQAGKQQITVQHVHTSTGPTVVTQNLEVNRGDREGGGG